MVGATNVSNIYWMCLETCYLKENQIAESVYEANKIIYPMGIEDEKSMHARTVVYCSVEIMQTLTSAPNVSMIGTRGKRMVDMIIMLMMRTSLTSLEARRRRLTEGLL
jgi:hypothetical protein